ncbi:hypothetical protein [Candidatus Borrarchaeum sp.]|uniref:hypothetical protein n=1 Tax=Candidatus Borrarchaeum sp. TaxID=2846742 RepID=UPI002579ACFC|nr:hypothetical protein [Candidatus Borrarchaeum sp.]
MGKIDGCELCDAYDDCLHDKVVNNVVNHKIFQDEWKTVYKSMMPSKVLSFLRAQEKALRKKNEDEFGKFDSHKLRVCIFINALGAWPGKKISNTLRNSLIKEVQKAVDFIPTLETQLDDSTVKTLVDLKNHQKKQELYQQEETVQRLLQTSKTLRENSKTNLGARYEINREISEYLKEVQYASPQVAEYFLEEGNDWYNLAQTSEAKWVEASMEWIEIAKLIFNRLEWTQEVEKCEKIIYHLKNLPSSG